MKIGAMKIGREAALGIVLFAVAAASTAAAVQDAVQIQPGRFMIFFDWGKPAIGRDAGQTIDASVAAWRMRPLDGIMIEGHGDRSGSVGANRRAALVRAAAVRDELVRRGVPAAAITVRSWGEERPLIATEDGVREVQNRRVEIMFGTR